MQDFATLRRRMVDNQIRTGGVTDAAVIAAFLAVAREGFVDAADQPFAYADSELKVPGGGSRTQMPPVQLARMIQTLSVAPGSSVMTVACGSGYSAAILARLAGSIVGVEENTALAELASRNLEAAGAGSTTVVAAPLTSGHPAEAPYDAILIDGAVEFIPDVLLGQLRPGGLLAAVERDERLSRAMLYESGAGGATKWPQFDAWASLLPGFAKERAFVF